jgi:hypothetical protein
VRRAPRRMRAGSAREPSPPRRHARAARGHRRATSTVSGVNRGYSRRHRRTWPFRDRPGLTSKLVRLGAYQSAYQSVRPGPTGRIHTRTLATLNTRLPRSRFLADTEDVTDSNPVSTRSITVQSYVNLGGSPFARISVRWTPGAVSLSGRPDAVVLSAGGLTAGPRARARRARRRRA